MIKQICRWLLKEEIEEYLNKISAQTAEITKLKLLLDDKFSEIKPTGEISNSELRELLTPYCNEIHLSDMTYGLCSVAEAKKYSEQTKISIKEWIAEKYDCDEFSFALAGYWNLDLYQYPLGIVWSSSHAFNIFIDDKKEIYIVEPQTNKFTPIKDLMKNKIYYPFRFIII